jgi:hypothetical protein
VRARGAWGWPPASSASRVTLLLLLVVPALFDAVVLATTPRRSVEVTLGTLVEPGATIVAPGSRPDPFDLGLLDDGRRSIDERALSLVFLGNTAVSFLTGFLSFYLVHERRAVDERLVLSGYRPGEVLLAKLVVLVILVALLAAYEAAAIRPFFVPRDTLRVAEGFFLGGLSYGSLGLLIGALTRQELEGVFLVVLLANIDAGWLQNPAYYAGSERRWLIEDLPGYYPAQIAVTGAFADRIADGAALRSLAYAAAALLAALLAFRLRLRAGR